MTTSRQTLSQSDRRTVASWAADCAERVLGLFEAENPDELRPRKAIAFARAFACGEITTAVGVRERFGGGNVTGTITSPAAVVAARAAGQSSAVCHMGAHALGAAAYAVKAVRLSRQGEPNAAAEEIHWQVSHMSPVVRKALRALPALGSDPSGPLGPGLLSSGELGQIIAELQVRIA